jgi:hypothetical protein
MNSPVHARPELPIAMRVRIMRELAVVRQEDIVSGLRDRGVKLSQGDLSNLELGVRPLSTALAKQIGEVLVAILQARERAVRELLFPQ